MLYDIFTASICLLSTVDLNSNKKVVKNEIIQLAFN